MSEAGASDRASLFATAAKALSRGAVPGKKGSSGCRCQCCCSTCRSNRMPKRNFSGRSMEGRRMRSSPFRTATCERSRSSRTAVSSCNDASPDGDTDLTRLSRHLFSAEPPPERERTGELVWFSAPGEGRECVEIARRILKASGAMAFGSTRSRFSSARLSSTWACSSTRWPARRSRRTSIAASAARIPPAGRSWRCSAARSKTSRRSGLPSISRSRQVPAHAWRKRTDGRAIRGSHRDDEVFGVLSERQRRLRMSAFRPQSAKPQSRTSEPDPASDDPVVVGTLRAPWKWESLLVESAVIGGSRTLGAASERPGRAVSPADPRADGRRAGLVAHPALRTRAAESRAPARLCAAAGRDDLGVARRSDLGRLAAAPRGVRAAHPAQTRTRAAGARRSAPDGGDRTGLATRSPRRARRSPAVARSGAAGESIRPRLRRQPASGPRPRVQGRVRARPGGADVSAEAA